MRIKLPIIILLCLSSCVNSNHSKQDKIETNLCDYIKDYVDVGNRIVDTFRLGKRLIDPIDDFENFKEAKFGFLEANSKIYRKAKTHRNCNEKFIDVEYYQEFTSRIELESYKEYNDRYFTTKNKVKFWWVNSDGHLIFPINNADSKTFQPFENICGGKDKNGIYYGCPNLGVYKLDIPINSNYKFIPKENNYWNSPNHYVIVDDKVYDVKYEFEKGYFCELDKSMPIKKVLKLLN